MHGSDDGYQNDALRFFNGLTRYGTEGASISRSWRRILPQCLNAVSKNICIRTASDLLEGTS